MKEITMTQPTEVASVDSFITQAIKSGASIEVMERLFALQEKAMLITAKSAFDQAMSKAQGEFPIIQKKKEGGKTASGAVAYKYAPIEEIEKEIRPILTKYGLSSSFKTEITADKVKVSCIAKHQLGHSEFSEMELPFGTKTNVMSAPQVVVATVTFAKRYTFCNVFGITVGGEDTDTKNLPKVGAVVPPKAQNLKSQITFLLKELKVNLDRDKSEVEKEIKELTKLDPKKEENLVEIKNRLEVLLQEQNENRKAPK